MVPEICNFLFLSPAIGADWGILTPLFSSVFHAKWLDFFFDATFLFLPAGNSDESQAIHVFYTWILVNVFSDQSAHGLTVCSPLPCQQTTLGRMDTLYHCNCPPWRRCQSPTTVISFILSALLSKSTAESLSFATWATILNRAASIRHLISAVPTDQQKVPSVYFWYVFLFTQWLRARNPPCPFDGLR